MVLSHRWQRSRVLPCYGILCSACSSRLCQVTRRLWSKQVCELLLALLCVAYGTSSVIEYLAAFSSIQILIKQAFCIHCSAVAGLMPPCLLICHLSLNFGNDQRFACAHLQLRCRCLPAFCYRMGTFSWRLLPRAKQMISGLIHS